MSIAICKKSRRQFLVGSGKTLLALPLLPSLIPSSLLAQTSSTPRRIMMVHFGHISMNSAWPSKSIATSPIGADGAKEVLLSTLSNSSAISPILSSAGFETLRQKGLITLTRGITNYFTPAGHGAQAISGCANYRADQYYPGPFPSIDTVMEASSVLYPSASTPSSTVKVMRVNDFEYSLSYKASGTSGVQAVNNFTSVSTAYNQLFSSLTNGTTPPPSTTTDPVISLKSDIVNAVYASYVSAKSSRKISSDDKLRLDEHLSNLTDLQKKYTQTVTPPISNNCSKPAAPGSPANDLGHIPLYLDMYSIAFKCGISKVGLLGVEGHVGSATHGKDPAGTQLHNGIFHNTSGRTFDQIKQNYVSWKKWYLDQILNKLLLPLNQEEGTSGRTYLDNMLTVVLTENGMSNDFDGQNHPNSDYQTLFFGSMGGRLRAGRYISLPALPYNTMLITLLELMGIPSSEYSSYNAEKKGYGLYSGTAFANRKYSPITELLS